MNEENIIHEKNSLESKQSPSYPKRFQNDKLMITSVFIASVITFLIYTVPD